MSDAIKALEEQQQREQAALTLKQERQKSLALIQFPKRKTSEMNLLSKAASSASNMLEVYDVQPSPPALADLLAQTFNECVARLTELTTSKKAD